MDKKNKLETKELFKLLVENTVEVIWTMNLEGHFTYISPSVEMLRGYTAEEAMNLTYEETVTPESFEASMIELQKYLSKPVDELPFSYTIELEQYKKDGTTVWTLVTIKPIIDDGEVIELQGRALDISERKRTDMLREVTYKIANASTQNISLDELYSYIHTEISKILYAKNFYISLYDSEKELLFFPYYEDENKTKEHDTSTFIRKFEKGLTEYALNADRGILITDKDIKRLTKKGEIEMHGKLPKNWMGTPLKVNNRAIGAIVLQSYSKSDIYSKDDLKLLEFISGQIALVINRKRAENALIASEEKYSALVEHSRDIIVIVQEEKIAYVNKATKQIIGEEPEKIIGMDFLSWVGPEFHEKVAEHYKDRISGKKVSNIYEIAILKKDGSSVPVEVNASLISYQGKPADLIIVRDLSERKKAQEELREKTEFLDAVVNNSFDGIFVIDENFNYKFINPASGRIMGHDPEDWIGKRAGTNRHPDDEKISIEAIFSALNGEPSTCEVRVKHSDGEYRFLEMRYSLMMIGDEAHILGMVNDISEKKKIETALVTSEEKYRHLFERSPDSIAIMDMNGVIVECNNATAELTEMKKEDIIGKRFDELGLLDKNRSETYINEFRAHLNIAEISNSETELLMKGGRSKWVETFYSLLRRDGAIFDIQMISRDITDKKLTEIKMRKKLMKFDMREGNIYLSQESRANQSIEAFRELLMIGYKGTLISRHSRKEFQNVIDYSFNYIKISETDNDNHVQPKYNAIRDLLTDLPRGEVVHIDCVEYLVSRFGFKRTLNIIQYLKDLAVSKNFIVLLSVDPKAIYPKDMKLIEKESKEILYIESLAKISSKLLDILEYIEKLNKEGLKPSYSEIGDYFQLSKPTARARIRQLGELKTVNEIQRGRMKVLELTEKGKNYLAM